MHYVVGDLHGCLEPFIRLLSEAGLVDSKQNWTGGSAQLWCLGDYTDRGPDGVGVIELLMRLEQEAKAAGGAVNALLGNHDVMLIGAKRFGPIEMPSFKRMGQRMTFEQLWRRVGGQPQDLERLTQTQLEWLMNRPAMALVANNLLVHADSLFYLDCGDDLEAVNETLNTVLHSDFSETWDLLFDAFTNRFAYINGGQEAAHEMLNHFGGERIVHGHTPIYGLVGYPAHYITDPLVYNNGLCMNVDHCLWNNGPGFIVPLESDIAYIEAEQIEQAPS